MGFGQLSIDHEVEVIRRGLEPLIDAAMLTVEVLPRATPAALHGHLSTGNYRMVHFIGLVVLLGLMFAIAFVDIDRIVSGDTLLQ